MRLNAPALACVALALAACSPAETPASGAVDAPAPATPSAPTAPSAPSDAADDAALAGAVAAILGEDAGGTRTVARFVGEGSGRLALVYLVGMRWCGTGGCNLLILRQGDAGWEQIGNVARVSNPVRVLTTSTNGLPDLGVTVSGGGGPPAYEARLSFDGAAYPRFPSDEPLTGAEGTVVITDADLPPPPAD